MPGEYNRFDKQDKGASKICERCKKPFTPKEPHHKICYRCFSYSSKNYADSVELSIDYLADGYFDSHGNLLEELVTTTAEDIAKKLGEASPQMTKHQLRRFYNHTKLLERKLDLTGDYKSINVELKTLIAHATNAACKIPASIPKIFESFIRKNMETVKDSKTFRGFLEHFQAIVGFSECYLKR